MKAVYVTIGFLALSLVLAGCLTTPVSQAGGPGAVTIENTNPNAITAAASSVFANYGYSVGPTNYPSSVSFDKPGGTFDSVMWGSFGETTSIRVQLTMAPFGEGSDYRVTPTVFAVNDDGMAGFEDPRRLTSLWALEFKPIMRQIAAQAAGAGAGF